MVWATSQLNILIGFPGAEAFMCISSLILQMAHSLVQRLVSCILTLSVIDWWDSGRMRGLWIWFTWIWYYYVFKLWDTLGRWTQDWVRLSWSMVFATDCSPVPPMSSSPVPMSMPLHASSKRTKSNHYTLPVSLQSNLKEALSGEIHNHTWEFDAERITKILSPTNEGPSKGKKSSVKCPSPLKSA